MLAQTAVYQLQGRFICGLLQNQTNKIDTILHDAKVDSLLICQLPSES